MVRARLASLALASSLLALSGCSLGEHFHHNRPGLSPTTREARGQASCCCDSPGEIGTDMEGPGLGMPPPDTSIFSNEPPTLQQGPQIVPGTPWSPPQPRIVPVPQPSASPMPYTP